MSERRLGVYASTELGGLTVLVELGVEDRLAGGKAEDEVVATQLEELLCPQWKPIDDEERYLLLRRRDRVTLGSTLSLVHPELSSGSVHSIPALIDGLFSSVGGSGLFVLDQEVRLMLDLPEQAADPGGDIDECP